MNGLVVTVTAPGADVLPFDPAVCARRRPHVCSGHLGCRVDQTAAREWSETAAERLRRLVHACPGASAVDEVHWERQRRGVAHAHLVLLGPPDGFLDRLSELAPSFGFGYVKAAG